MSLTTPVDVDFGEDGNKDLDTFVFNNLTALINAYDNLHKQKLPEWRRLTKGKPKDKTRNFPWPNASNVIVQLIGENVDTIKAVQLGTIYEILPLWVAGLVGDWSTTDYAEEQRSSVERFMDQMGLSKDELDLYRVESKAAHDIASLGSVVIKFPWITRCEQIVTGIDSSGGIIEEEVELYDGPRPEKLAYEDWAATPTANTWEDAKFKYHEYRLTKQDCEYKAYKGQFDKKAWDSIKDSPDLTGLTAEEEQKLNESNVDGPTPNKDWERWRFYECWMKYIIDGRIYNIIYIAHLDGGEGGKICKMKSIFNFYPKNEEPWEFGRLGYSEDGLIGYGFAEMGEMLQEEVSTGHNQRVDNRTLANTSVLLGGNNPRIDSGIALFPGAVLPFSKDDVQVVQLGTNYPSSVAEESLSLSLAKARFGTDMLAAEGNGSGSVDKKGNYNSMGTFSVMQQGARRININITDFRYLHLNCGQKFLKQYANFGVGESRYKYLGKQADYLRKAMQAIKEGRLELPIKAATASINKEVEKTSGMLFTQVMQRHYGAIAQILQGVQNPGVPPEIKQFLLGSIGGMSYIMSKLLRAFGYDDIARMQPELEILKKIQEANKQPQQGANNNGQQPVQGTTGQPTQDTGRSNGQEVAGAQINNPGTPQPASTGVN
jgi:hypothetical protein